MSLFPEGRCLSPAPAGRCVSSAVAGGCEALNVAGLCADPDCCRRLAVCSHLPQDTVRPHLLHGIGKPQPLKVSVVLGTVRRLHCTASRYCVAPNTASYYVASTAAKVLCVV